MIVFRIARTRYINDISGTGAKIYGGRWNRKGLAVLYTAEHRSLAALELLVHLNKEDMPNDLQILSLKVPGNSIQTIEWKSLNEQSNDAFQKIGNTWIKENHSLCLKVPSIVINEEFNVLLNPNHKYFKKASIENVKNFVLDKRLFK